MKKIFKWAGIGLVALLFIGIIVNKNKPNIGNSTSSNTSHVTSKGYTLQPREITLMEYLLKDDVNTFSEGGETLLAGKDMLSVATVDVAKAYNDNQVAADQKYFKKTFLLSGKIDSINSGLGNEPYIALRGLNQFSSPQVRFYKADIEKISLLKKGQKIVLVCDGVGAIAGIPVFKNCQFADDYANQKTIKLKAEITQFLEGKKPQSENAAILPIAAIVMARNLPDNSACFTGEGNCRKALDAAFNDKASFESKLSAVRSELVSIGLQVPEKP